MHSTPNILRIAIGSFMLESNAHSPVSTRAEFAQNVLIAPERLLADLASRHPKSPGCLAGFYDEMQRLGAWTPVTMIAAAVGASGPIDQAWFDEIVASMVASLKRALVEGPLDAVFLSLHGAAIATVDIDPDGSLLAAVRAAVGERVPILATLDLHGNISSAMVQHADYLSAYLTNPHVDTHERGAECARALHDALTSGKRWYRAFVKLPFIPPSVTQNTERKPGANTPYGDIIHFGQRLLIDDVKNVSVLSGFTLGDTPKAGMSVIVSARSAEGARAAAKTVATQAWADRARYVPKLTSLDDATRMALDVAHNESKPPLLFADVADNAGGGGRANTVWILKAFYEAGVTGCTLAIFYDPALAAEAHRLGVGATFNAEFNRIEAHPLSGKFCAPATIAQLHDGEFIGRRGIAAGHAISLGPSARLIVGGIQVIVVTVRQQAKDPIFMEALGVDINAQRSLIIKSRGHFRAWADEFFSDERIIEVDVPGLTTPVLKNVAYEHIPRPLYPLDDDWGWQVGEPEMFAARQGSASLTREQRDYR